MKRPSGDHTGSPTPIGNVVSWRASPPSSGRRKIWVSSPLRSERNAMAVPSGDQRGELSLCFPWVSGRSPLPSAAMMRSSDHCFAAARSV